VKLDPTPEVEEDPTTDVVMELADEQDEQKKRNDSHVEFIEKVVINLDDDVDDGASTLVGHEYGDKEIEMEVTDSEEEQDSGEQAQSLEECGVKRKRTIRVIIRSRAFL
jgi:hypothetical protein